MNDVTKVLQAVAAGDPCAASHLLPLVYDELRKLAACRMNEEAPGNTLDPTALVHEAYLRLIGPAGGPAWDGRHHFFAAAAEAMRRILIDAARRRNREKHGGGWRRVDIEPDGPALNPRDDLVALDAALTRLAGTEPVAARLVELRHFGGMTVPEAAAVLGLSPRGADRLWAYARAWLLRELTHSDADPRP